MEYSLANFVRIAVVNIEFIRSKKPERSKKHHKKVKIFSIFFMCFGSWIEISQWKASI